MQPIAVLHASQSWPPFKVANWNPLQQSISAASRWRWKRKTNDIGDSSGDDQGGLRWILTQALQHDWNQRTRKAGRDRRDHHRN